MVISLENLYLLGLKVMLHETIHNDDFLAKHCFAMLEYCHNCPKQCCYNVVTLYCAKNRHCKLFRVTSALKG